ncbi:UDP-2,3-diacylglucosamine diphosphatase [Lichenihabitans sp. Uapishka_5]|uniref:UDP-2,3-diacylglucosamine diphosphatase n=1 Tax=Lichenihabitans sp. Uapishka_5 TaxID=3037302 RepID=UPI0029E7F197|nr:UDP-2,3-diacylglucosamine diphosphatase [Lichenihabitans sp. Uapishka_5]MDX7949694.1 UDP-2,3-diacylglucosamine diphosphatase [Lichenihabitans sp. Uapishka_5]
MKPQARFRTLFISDLHLGTKGCQGELFLDFLRHNDAETIYLVGDIIDGWQLRSGWYWPEAHNTIVQKFLRKARKGCRIIFIPGNHDDFARDYAGLSMGGIQVVRNATHVTAAGRRYHVTHGDEYDIVIRHARWLAFLGDWAYQAALFCNTYFNYGRRKLGLPYWSFSAWAKLKVKNAVNFIGAFEDVLSEYASKHGFDGIICGHIHHAVIRDLHGVSYVNTGDWVESCTAVAEHFDGSLEILKWRALRPQREPEGLGEIAEPEYA